MKNIKFLTGIILILTAFTFTSCENEPIDPSIDLNNPSGPSGPVVFKADFSGNTWNATTAQAIIEGNTMSIAGIKPNGEGFGFLLQANAVGTYPANANFLAFNPAGSEYGYLSVNFDNPNEDTGSITITNINTTNQTISGTFNFKGYWSDTDVTNILPVQFTNGVFQNIPYITQNQTGDTFYAKIDGVEFVDTDILGAEVTGSETWINIAATDAALNDMTVAFKSTLTPGTYTFTGAFGDGVNCFYAPVSGNDFDAVSGTLTLISITADRVKGTFSFIGSDGVTTKTISEGAFDVGY